MKTNIVIFENNPEILQVFRVPESAVPESILKSIVGIFFNCSDATDEDWENFNVVNDALGSDAMKTNGVEELNFPFQPLPGETVYRIFMAM